MTSLVNGFTATRSRVYVYSCAPYWSAGRLRLSGLQSVTRGPMGWQVWW